jgi:hypothetical protein
MTQSKAQPEIQSETQAELPQETIDRIIAIVTADYAKFPEAQTYGIYAEDVYFKDPVYEFKGLKQYQKMIGFITTWFANLKLVLHTIEQIESFETSRSNLAEQPEAVTTIKTEWTMSWNSPMPWKPRISVDGWSELGINQQGQIISHVDYWHCSRWHVVKQHIPFFGSQDSN